MVQYKSKWMLKIKSCFKLEFDRPAIHKSRGKGKGNKLTFGNLN